MKLLSQDTYLILENYIMTNARPIEKAVFKHYFQNKDGKDIINALSEFQNDDGGFGHGLESDFILPDSSPMATSIGLRYLSIFDNLDDAKLLISKAINYLETNYDDSRKGWYSVPSTINNYPHAPWWTYKDDIGMTVIDYSWGNPSAEIIGYLYKYKSYLSHLDIDELLTQAINYFNEKTEYKSEHEVYCYIRMYNHVDKKIRSKIEEKIKEAVSQLVNVNELDWENYVPMPIKFIEYISENHFGITDNDININLDYLITLLEKDKLLSPNWKWDDYDEEWEVAKNEWSGLLILEALLALKKFNRIMFC